jgi:D-alanyl-D-alanine carboxypeptidase (penicillin-binding protein 5/6)
MFKTQRFVRHVAGLAAALSCALGGLVPALAVAASPSPFVSAAEPRYAAIVLDAASGEVLYAQHPDSPRYPASITKVMTLYLTFEALSEGRLKLTDRVVYSQHAAAQPATRLGLQAGDSISVDEAIRAMSVKSANDAAVAMAERLGGTEPRFAALMTLRGQELGMRNTRFVNAHGLPDSRNVSTARDLAILSRAVMRDFPQYYSYFGLKGFTFRGNYVPGHKRLLDSMPGFDGLKTGFTNASGYNLAGSAVRGGRRLIAIVLGGRSAAWRDDNMEDLLLTGFDVLDRRSRGDRTTIAANLYDNDPSGPVVRPSTEEGDGDQSGLRITLTDVPQRRALQPVAPSSAVKPVVKGTWGVQVGSFKSQTLARKQLSIAKSNVGRLVSQADDVVEATGGAFRAQFQGLSEGAARQVCAAISAKRQPCLIVAPR